MKRSEANRSHHQKKVVLPNQGTDSNNKINYSCSKLNNNTVSNKQQNQTPALKQVSTLPNTLNSLTSTTSDIHKDSNFEYDDNEWDVGIGDLIIDLDADIEKSSVSQQPDIKSETVSIVKSVSQTSDSTLPVLPSVGSLNLLESDSDIANLQKSQNTILSPIRSKNRDILGASAVKPPKSVKLLISTACSKGGTTSSEASNNHSSSSSSSSLSSLTPLSFGHQHHHSKKINSIIDAGIHSTSNLSKHSELLNQLNSIRNLNPLPAESSALKLKHSSSTDSSSLSNMSSTNNSSGGKSATKLAVDHQATLDKGLKMKIKRTKPGTKTSEAKHEIVKAEQNGTSSLSSSADENNGNSNSSSNSSNKKHSSQLQSQTQQVVNSTMQQQVQQGSKRGSSGHRRDKAKEKTTHHNQRDKNEHFSAGAGSSATSCSCTHEIQVQVGNGIQQSCSSASCIKIKTSDQTTNALTQRLSNQNNSSTSTTNSLFSSNSNTSSSLSSSNNTVTAPGPPSSKENIKNKSVVSITTHSSSQISSVAAANNSQLSNPQYSTSSSGSSSCGSGNSNSSSTSSTISTSSGSNSSTANNVLKSQLQSIMPPSSLLNALTSGSSSTAGPSSSGSVSSSTTTVGSLLSSDESNSLFFKDDKISTNPPPAKRYKCEPKDMVDICVGTSVGTITEPDCLGPCEPGTSVTLEGIVWHETEGGVLVVNVTWRGKTYVGTLIDCTKHDWAPPRFCDSPTEELDSRTPKGRAKRNRGSALFPVNDLSNFTETRSSMHSKLRNGGTKGRGSRATTTATTDSNFIKTSTASTPPMGNSLSGSSSCATLNTPSTSPVAFLPPRPEKRKSKDECPSPGNGGSGSTNSSMSGSVMNSSNINHVNISSMINNGTPGTQRVINPMTGLNVQISTKKSKSTTSSCAISPVLLECPEQDCSKKYKHANGLRYHQSHAHGSISSMDEDSSHPPESPQRIAPPTTPSPLPTIQSTNVSTVPTLTTTSVTTNTSELTNITSPSSGSQAIVSVAVTLNPSQSATIPTIATTTTTTTATTSAATTISTSSTTTTPIATSSTMLANPPCSAASPNLLMTVNTSAVAVSISPSHTILTSMTSASEVSSAAYSQPTVTTPSTAGGSITTGVAGQSQLHVTPVSSSTLLSCVLTGPALSMPISPQQSVQVQETSHHQHQLVSPQSNDNGVAMNSTQCDPSEKSKPSILRFGQLPGEVDHNERLTPVVQGPSSFAGNQGSTALVASNNLSGPSNVGIPAMQPSNSVVLDGFNIKSQNCSKQKKTRKSPGPSDFEVADENRAEDVQSPAYSDISDDSAPVVDTCDSDKSKNPPLPDIPKKSNDVVTGQLGPLSGYGMYPYYPAMPHQSSYYSSDHSGKPPGLGHLPLGPHAAVDYKSKEPPLDLMNKPNQQQQQPPPGQHPHLQLPPGDADVPVNKDCPTGPQGHTGAGKIMQNFYSYGYMPTGFSYNIDPSYGTSSVLSEDSKLVQQQQPPVQIKEERIKECSSPNEIPKIGPQIVPTKLIKSEPIAVKDIKTETGHSLHSKDQTPPGSQQHGQSSISVYSGMFQRHGPSAPTSQHMNRDEDLRRLFNYSEQRRSNTSGNSLISNLNMKDEPPSSSQPLSGHPNQGQNQPTTKSETNTSLSSQQPKGPKNQLSSMKQPKDMKTEEKDILKVKQEGQKPTMETQGPPPPPTSQYYPHPLYMSAGPFGFDPNHQIYRNMLVPAASYNAPSYHLQIPRFTSPEDLSRNPSTKALDLLQHHASQYYNSHKIHELREGALKSPNNNVKVSVSSPNLSQQPSQNPNMCIPPSNNSISSLQQQQQQLPSSSNQQPPHQTGSSLQSSQGGSNAASGTATSTGASGSDLQKDISGPSLLGQAPAAAGAPPPPQPGQTSRSPPPQRHVHTHHHTHVGLGYPMFQSPYGAVLASQQAAAAVTVISPFQTGPPTK